MAAATDSSATSFAEADAEGFEILSTMELACGFYF